MHLFATALLDSGTWSNAGMKIHFGGKDAAAGLSVAKRTEFVRNVFQI